jgi:CBS domain-containing protein
MQYHFRVLNVSTVEDYMSTKLVICDLQSSIFELAKVMVDSNVSSVAIIEEKEEGEEQDAKRVVVGILTERDIIKSIARGGRLDDITAGSIMSTSPILSVRKGQPIEKAALLMIRNKVRHLLVENPDNNNSTTGIITTTDLARYLQKRMKEDNSIVTASVGEDSKEQQREGQDKQEQSSPISSERLLSEVWELYF